MSPQIATQPVCTVRICGGLGNQMFQYAAACALALRTDSQLELDLAFYSKRRHRAFELDQLPITAKFTLPEKGLNATRRCQQLFRRSFQNSFRSKKTSSKTYKEPHYHYDPEWELLPSPVTLDGYFQSERYFASHADTIRAELAIPEPNDADSQELARRMADCVPTALHIRRGDYLSNPAASQVFARCPLDYYTKAMKQIPGDDPVFVFSDDTEWVKKNLPAVKPLVFSEGNTPRPAMADLWLMTQAHHHIIANSSFSWWGAWLAGEQKGMTIAPQQWFVDTTTNDHDLIPNHWVRL